MIFGFQKSYERRRDTEIPLENTGLAGQESVLPAESAWRYVLMVFMS